MTDQEFIYQFDILYNNISNNHAPGISDYEKSVFATKAQKEIVREYFSGKNKYQSGFDGADFSLSSAIKQTDFSNIIRTIEVSPSDDTLTKIDNRSILFSIDTKEAKVLIPIQKSLRVTTESGTRDLQIVPINFVQYQQLITNPYPYPHKNQAWELINSATDIDTINIEVIVGEAYNKANIKYYLRFVKEPYPIILTNLEDGLYKQWNTSIEGKTKPLYSSGEYSKTKLAGSREICELSPLVQDQILQRTVELAIVAYKGQGTELLSIGSASSTDLGAGASAK